MQTAPVTLTPEQKEFIEEHVMGTMFPWFRIPEQAETKTEIRARGPIMNVPFFCNILMQRGSNYEAVPGKISSSYYGFFVEIFDTWMQQQGLEYTTILRACVNCVSARDVDAHTNPHVDHFFPHNNWIMYLNTTDAPTLLFDNETLDIIDEITCEQYTAVTFASQMHAYRFPRKQEQRVVVVFTYI
jgi:hypothetical protein